jgi:hypothetical protein
MLYLKACPRCPGDLETREDSQAGMSLNCMQCGFEKFIDSSIVANLTGTRKSTHGSEDKNRGAYAGLQISRR